MRILLIPDPTSPLGEDAFVREVSKRAPARGHEVSSQVIPNAPVEAALETLTATGFALSSDLVLVNSLQPAAILAAKAAARKVVVRFIDSFAAYSPQALKEVQRLALKADALIVPSEYLSGIVRSWGVNGNIHRAPYAYDRIMAQQIALVTMRASRPAFQIVAAGPLNASTQPGFETLISAVARLRFDYHLLLIGDGPSLAALKGKAASAVITEKVSFLPAMPHPKMMEYFRASKAFVDPCGMEGFPTLSLHALSEGCPVIGARTGAIPEFIKNQSNGLLFQPGSALDLSEAIVTLWSERGLSLRLIEEGIKTVRTHTWDATVAAVFGAVEAVK